MVKKQRFGAGNSGFGGPVSSNVKSRPQYERFGETIRYLTVSELQRFFDCIEDYRHKLMFRMIYELGCRVGGVCPNSAQALGFWPKRGAISGTEYQNPPGPDFVSSRGLMNEIVSLLRSEGRMPRRGYMVRRPESYLFYPPGRLKGFYCENRLRQIFRRYAVEAGLDHEYGRDSQGRKLHRLSVHSLRHSHIMAYIHVHQLPLPIVQRQVGHKSLRSTSVYLNPSDEAVAEAYQRVQTEPRQASLDRAARRDRNP
jgi:integrase